MISRFLSLVLPVPLVLVASACSGNGKHEGNSFPDNFASLPDTAKVAFMMRTASPDSVARFICDAALGKVKEGRIDTLPVATAYAYGNYNDSSLIVFSREFDEYSADLPLDEKMKVYYMVGEYDAQRLGYELGLEYVDHIRTSNMDVNGVREEILAFKRACGEDSMTYVRFMKGFKTVLKADRGKDLPEDIYKEFIDN